MEKYALPQRSYGDSALKTNYSARLLEPYRGGHQTTWVSGTAMTLGALAAAREQRDSGSAMLSDKRRRHQAMDFEQRAFRQHAALVSTRNRLRTMFEYASAWAAVTIA